MTYQPKFTFTKQLVKTLNAIERLMGFLEGVPVSEEWLANMQQKALFKEAHSTAHIHGLRLKWNEAERILSNHESDATPDDIKLLKNYLEAFAYIVDFAKTDARITEATLFEMHKLLVRGVKGNRDHPGYYRVLQNQVHDKLTKEVVFIPPTAIEVSSLMRDFVLWLEEEKALPSVLFAGIAHYQLVNIHPYVGGNGRTARLLCLLLLYRAGYQAKELYPLSPFYDADLAGYYSALKTVRENLKDLTKWLEYFTSGMLKQLQEVVYEAKLAL